MFSRCRKTRTQAFLKGLGGTTTQVTQVLTNRRAGSRLFNSRLTALGPALPGVASSPSPRAAARTPPSREAEHSRVQRSAPVSRNPRAALSGRSGGRRAAQPVPAPPAAAQVRSPRPPRPRGPPARRFLPLAGRPRPSSFQTRKLRGERMLTSTGFLRSPDFGGTARPRGPPLPFPGLAGHPQGGFPGSDARRRRLNARRRSPAGRLRAPKVLPSTAGPPRGAGRLPGTGTGSSRVQRRCRPPPARLAREAPAAAAPSSGVGSRGRASTRSRRRAPRSRS